MAAHVEQRAGYRIITRRGNSPGAMKSGIGQASGSYGLYQTPNNSGQADFYRPRLFSGGDLGRVVDDYDWLELLDYSRQLFSQLGNLGYAVVQKNLYAVGDAWKPQYIGKNKAWGEEAEEWLHNVWLPQCNIRGGMFNWQLDLFLTGVALDVDGDELCVYVIDEAGFPKLKYYSSHQIGNGPRGGDQVKGGVLDGGKLCNGIIHDRLDRFLGVRVLDQESADGYTDIPAQNCQLLFEPEWRCQGRGIPRMARSTLDGFDVQDIGTFIKRGVKLDASIGLLHHNEGGEATPGTDILTERTTEPGAVAKGIKSEYRMGGEIFYLRSLTNDRLESLKSERPHPNVEAFIARLERRCFLSLGWFYELMDPSKLGGASVRLIQNQGRTSISSRQRTLALKRRGVQFAVGQAMETGRISRNQDGGDFLRWGFSLPAEMTVDQGYEEQADRENFVLGTTTLMDIAQRKGKWWETLNDQRLKENVRLVKDAVDLVTEAAKLGAVLEFRDALALCQSRAVGPKGLRDDKDTTEEDKKKEEESK